MELVSVKTVKDECARGDESYLLATVRDENGTLRELQLEEKHPNWAAAKRAIEDFRSGRLEQEELASTLLDLVHIAKVVNRKLSVLPDMVDGRMTVNDDGVFVDGDPIDPVLERHILGMLSMNGKPKDEENWKAFAAFVDNLYANTNDHVRKQLFGWLTAEVRTGRNIVFTEDGCFLGYKGCAGTPEAPMSINTGRAYVDNELFEGSIPNKPGTIVSMVRSEVMNDPAVGCAAGLHVGTWEYASDWARGVVLTVKVNPRDVVSVPTDCEWQKLRCCRYEVLEAVDGPMKASTFFYASPEADVYDDRSQDLLEAIDAVEEGEEVTFTYRKASTGEVKEYTIVVEEVTPTHLKGYLADDEDAFRSFLKSNIEALDGEDYASPDEEDEDDYEECTCAYGDCCACGDCSCSDDEDEDDSDYATAYMKAREEEHRELQERLEQVQEGATITFLYTKEWGDECQEYTLTVERITDDRFHGRIPSGGYRTFLKDHITYLEEEEETENDAPTPSTPAASSTKRLSAEVLPGMVVEITYKKDDGAPSTYTVETTSVDGQKLTGRLTTGDGGYRSFLLDKVLSYVFKKAEGDDGWFSRVEDPGTEEDEEIRRYGYSPEDH